MVFHDRNTGVVGHIEERELYEILRVESLTVEEIGDEHLKKMMMRNDTSLACALAREEVQTFSRPFFQICKIFFIGIAEIVFVICEVHLVNDADDLRSISVLADGLARIFPFDQEWRIHNRHPQVLVDDLGRFFGAQIGTCNDSVDREVL